MTAAAWTLLKGADMRRLCAGSHVRRYLCSVEFSRRVQQGLDRRRTGAPPRSSHLQWRFLDHCFPFGSCHLNCFRLLWHENCSIRKRTYCSGGQKGHCPCFHVRYVVQILLTHYWQTRCLLWPTSNPNVDFWHFPLQLSALGQSWVSCWLAMVSLLSS